MITRSRGFTLVELLVVVAIIGLLATLSVLALGSARVRARDAKRLSDIKTVQTALELYHNDQGRYPVGRPSIPSANIELGSGEASVLTSVGFEAAPSVGATGYILKVPRDPLVTQNYVYVSRMQDYVTACNAGPCATYSIQFILEGGMQGLPVGAACYAERYGLHGGGC